MGNVVSKTNQEKILALGRLTWSLRRIEAATGCRRETVGKYLRDAGVFIRPPGRWGHLPKAAIEVSLAPVEPPKAAIEVSLASVEPPKTAIEVSFSSLEPPKAAKGLSSHQRSLCEPYRETIAAAVDRGVCAKVIWEELEGFRGTYASVMRFVRKLKAESRSGPPESLLVGVIHTAPGAEAQVDYGQGPLVKDSDGVYRRTRLFAMTLGWSRKAVWLLSMSSSATVWSTLHEKAFRQLGGTPKVIVLDNLKEGVKDVDYCDPTINLEYAQVLRHYDVVAVPARVRDPDRKGKVESSVNYAQLRLEHRTFDSLDEAQAFLDHWQTTVADVRKHGTTQRIVNEHFAEEVSHLQPLPTSPCPRFKYGQRKVTTTGEVQVGMQRYPAPATHVGLAVQVQHDDSVVRIVDLASGKLLLEHPKEKSKTPVTSLSSSTGASCKAAIKGLSSSPAGLLVQRGHQLGSHIGLLCAAIAANDEPEFAMRRLHALLRFVDRQGAARVDVACAAAIDVGAPTYRCVRLWLEHHPPVSLAQVDPLIRQLAAYRDVVARLSSTTNTTTENTDQP